MKPPKCKLCGKEHYGLCEASKAAVQARQNPKKPPRRIKKGRGS